MWRTILTSLHLTSSLLLLLLKTHTFETHPLLLQPGLSQISLHEHKTKCIFYNILIMHLGVVVPAFQEYFAIDHILKDFIYS